MYTDKYDEFQNALTKSNEVFGGFKDEMEKVWRLTLVEITKQLRHHRFEIDIIDI